MTPSPRIFVGRAHELAELTAGLDDARAGRGGLFFVVGEPGIGKTLLADRVVALAEEREFLACGGRCWEVGGAPAYWPWLQVMRALARSAPSLGVEAAVADTLSRLLPEGNGPPSSPASDLSQERFRLFDSVVRTLEDVALAKPLLLVLDDLHAADPSSLSLLLFLARELRRSRICVLGTYRDQEALLSGDRGATLARIAREGTHLPLRRFAPDEVRKLLRLRSGGSPAEDLVASIVATTEGHPLFVDETYRALGPNALVVGIRERLPIPATVREAIRSRIEQLPPELLPALETAAVLGREVPVATLAAMLGKAVGEVRAPLDGALAAGVLVELDTDLLAFSHALVREALYKGIEAKRRSTLHAHAAEVIERGGALGAGHGEIAEHLLLGVAAVGPSRALCGATRAARRALAKYAFEDAVAILERALTELEPELDDARALCEALICLGEARVRARSDGTLACTRAAALAHELRDSSLLAQAALALGAEIAPAVINRTLVELLQRARDALPTKPSRWRARVLARLAGALQPASDPREPVALAWEAIAMARATADDETLRAVLSAAGSALVDYAPPGERVAVDGELLRMAEASSDLPLAFRAQLRLVFDYLQLGDVGAADIRIRACGKLADELERPRFHFYATMLLAVRATQRGRFTEAQAHRSRAFELLGDGEDATLASSLRQHAFATALLQYDDVHLEQVAGGLIHSLHGLPTEWTGLLEATVHARSGRLDQAREILREMHFEAPWVSGEVTVLQLLTEACILTEYRDGAAQLIDWLMPSRQYFASWGISGLCVFGPCLGLLAGLEALLDRWADAERDFDAALARCDAVGAVPALGQVLLDYARALIRRGDRASRERAKTLLERVERLAADHEMPGLGRASIRLRGTDSPPVATDASAVPSVAPEFRLVREGDVWRVDHGNVTFRLKDSRGLAILARLIAEPGREMHVLTLGAAGDPGDLGDAGNVLDASAASAYKKRLDELRELAEDAEAFGDGERAERARGEIELLARQLAEGVGFGGRRRKAASIAERARVNVQRRVKDAVRRIEEQDAGLGRYLGWTIRTGAFCAYEPGKTQ